MTRRLASITLFAILAPSSATAQSRELPARVFVRTATCPRGGVEGTELLRLLGVELRQDGVSEVLPLATGETPAEDLLAVVSIGPDCDGGDASITIDDVATQKRVSRTMDLADVAPAERPRALAIATAELLRASWSELAVEDAPAPPAPVPEPVLRAVRARVAAQGRRLDPPQVPAARSAPAAARVLLAADVASFPMRSTALLGGRGGVLLRPPPGGPLVLHVEATAGAGALPVALGEVDLGLVAGGLGIGWEAGGGRLSVELAALVEGGWAWASGDPASEVVVSGSGGAVLVRSSLLGVLRARLGKSVELELRTAIGWTIAGLDARVDGQTQAGLGALALGASLGAVLAP